MRLIILCLLMLSGNAWADQPSGESHPLRLALSSVFLGERQDLILRWQHYLERGMGRSVVFVQRRTYREVNELFAKDRLDAGWVCASPYVMNRKNQKLLAVGVWRGKPEYQSYLIVPNTDVFTRSIIGLKGKLFAYTDPLSNSGYLVAKGELMDLGIHPDSYFSKTLFTYAHRKSIEAVAFGLVDGARVDGYIYDMLRSQNPELIAQTRVVSKSDSFGFPPIVARSSFPQADFLKLQSVLIGMVNDEEGRALLAEMGLDRFVPGEDNWYKGVEALIAKVNHRSKLHVPALQH